MFSKFLLLSNLLTLSIGNVQNVEIQHFGNGIDLNDKVTVINERDEDGSNINRGPVRPPIFDEDDEEKENNNSCLLANALLFDTKTIGYLSNHDDVDYFSLFIPNYAQVHVYMNDTYNLAPNLTLYNERGKYVSSATCNNGYSRMHNYLNRGVYYLRIDNNSYNNVKYDITYNYNPVNVENKTVHLTNEIKSDYSSAILSNPNTPMNFSDVDTEKVFYKIINTNNTTSYEGYPNKSFELDYNQKISTQYLWGEENYKNLQTDITKAVAFLEKEIKKYEDKMNE